MFEVFFTIVYNFTYLTLWIEQVFDEVVDHLEGQVGHSEGLADSPEGLFCVLEDELGVALVDVGELEEVHEVVQGDKALILVVDRVEEDSDLLEGFRGFLPEVLEGLLIVLFCDLLHVSEFLVDEEAELGL